MQVKITLPWLGCFDALSVGELLPPGTTCEIVLKEFPRVSPQLSVTERDQCRLRSLLRNNELSEGMQIRAKICLMAAYGISIHQTARLLTTTRTTVARCRERYTAGGLDCLFLNAPHGPSPRRIKPEVRCRIVAASRTGHELNKWKRRPQQRRRITSRAIGRQFGVSHTSVCRVWRENGLDPRCRALHKTEIRQDCAYIVGLSPHKIIAVGVDKTASTHYEIRKRVSLARCRELVGLNLHLSDFESVTAHIRPRFRPTEEFLTQLDQLAHPKLRLHLYCDHRLEEFEERLFRVVQRLRDIELHFASSGSRWAEFVGQQLKDLQKNRFRIVNLHPLENWLRKYGKMPLRHPPHFVRAI